MTHWLPFAERLGYMNDESRKFFETVRDYLLIYGETACDEPEYGCLLINRPSTSTFLSLWKTNP